MAVPASDHFGRGGTGFAASSTSKSPKFLPPAAAVPALWYRLSPTSVQAVPDLGGKAGTGYRLCEAMTTAHLRHDDLLRLRIAHGGAPGRLHKGQGFIFKLFAKSGLIPPQQLIAVLALRDGNW